MIMIMYWINQAPWYRVCCSYAIGEKPWYRVCCSYAIGENIKQRVKTVTELARHSSENTLLDLLLPCEVGQT